MRLAPSWMPSWLRDWVGPIGLIIAIGFAVHHTPYLSDLLIWIFRNMGEGGQAFVFLCANFLLIYFVVRYVVEKKSLDALENDKKQLEIERNQLQETMDRLAEDANKNIWQRPNASGVPFRPKEERRARFMSFLNLKGGPGKTTLAANIAACMAMLPKPKDRNAFHPEKILLVDLDFQGTLSNLCVEPNVRNLQRDHEHTSARLLEKADSQVLRRLMTDMYQVGNVSVIVADDKLEQADYTAQAKFFLTPEDDPRFRFRSFLHHGEIADNYDLVIFDCPPRLTTSSINAMACSDYLVIPAKLDEKSIDAIPRTLRLLSQLQHVANPQVLGIIANEVVYYRVPALTKAHAKGLQALKDVVWQHDRRISVFTSKVRLDNRIASQKKPGLVPAADPRVKGQFIGIAQEICRGITPWRP